MTRNFRAPSVYDTDGEYADTPSSGDYRRPSARRYTVRMRKEQLTQLQAVLDALRLVDMATLSADEVLHVWIRRDSETEARAVLLEAGKTLFGEGFDTLASPVEFGIGDESI